MGLAGLTLFLLAAVWLCTLSLASAEVITGGNYRISFSGSIMPAKLSRAGSQPISVSVRGAVKPLPGAPLQLFVNSPWRSIGTPVSR